MKKEYVYTPSDEVCSQEIYLRVDADSDIVEEIRFTGGCHGNTQGIAALVKGMKREEVIARLRGIRCKKKSTSCPDQLARVLEQM